LLDGLDVGNLNWEIGERMTTAIDATALFMLGLLGTGHCIGMCGPLVVAIPGQTGRFSAHVAYHVGRLITYSIIGAIMGAVGSGLIHLASVVGGNPMLWIVRAQVGVSILAGLFLLFFGLSRLGFVAEPQWLAIAMPNRMPGWQRLMSRAAAQRSNLDLFLIGLILGGLPCGLSYAAFTKAFSGAQMPAGAAMAFIFGLGTLPGMLLVGAGGAVLLKRFRQQADILAGLIMIGMAAVLIVKAVETII
jgi:sulfite exporter TauE/SafE